MGGVLLEVGEHRGDLLIEGIPLVVGVECRQVGIGITLIILMLETVETSDGNIGDTQLVHEAQSTDDGIVEMLPAAFDNGVEAYDGFLGFGLLFDIAQQYLRCGSKNLGMTVTGLLVTGGVHKEQEVILVARDDGIDTNNQRLVDLDVFLDFSLLIDRRFTGSH